MRIRYYLDPMSGIPHIYGHNVSEAEVEDVLSGAAEDRTRRIAGGNGANGGRTLCSGSLCP